MECADEWGVREDEQCAGANHGHACDCYSGRDRAQDDPVTRNEREGECWPDPPRCGERGERPRGVRLSFVLVIVVSPWRLRERELQVTDTNRAALHDAELHCA